MLALGYFYHLSHFESEKSGIALSSLGKCVGKLMLRLSDFDGNKSSEKLKSIDKDCG